MFVSFKTVNVNIWFQLYVCLRFSKMIMGVIGVFLQGKELTWKDTLGLLQEDQSKATVWKLKTCFYGLAKASLYCYNRVKDIMQHSAGTVSSRVLLVGWLMQCDGSPWLSHGGLYLGRFRFSMKVIPHLKAAFQIGCEEHNSFQLHWNGGSLIGGWNTGETVDVHKKSPTHSCGPHQSHCLHSALYK